MQGLTYRWTARMDDLLMALMGQPARDGRMPRHHPDAEADAVAQAAAQTAFLGAFDPVLPGPDSDGMALPAPVMPFAGRMAEPETGAPAPAMALVARADGGGMALGFALDKIATGSGVAPGAPPSDRAVSRVASGEAGPVHRAHLAEAGPGLAGFGADGAGLLAIGPLAPDTPPVAVAARAPLMAAQIAPPVRGPTVTDPSFAAATPAVPAVDSPAAADAAPVTMGAKARDVAHPEIAPRAALLPLGAAQGQVALVAGSPQPMQQHDTGGDQRSAPPVPKDTPPAQGMLARAPIWPDGAVKTGEPPLAQPAPEPPPAPERAPGSRPLAGIGGAWLSAGPDRPDALPQSPRLASAPAPEPAPARWAPLPDTGPWAARPVAPNPAMPDLAPDLLPKPAAGPVHGVGPVPVPAALAAAGVPQTPTTPVSGTNSAPPRAVLVDHPAMTPPQAHPQAVPETPAKAVPHAVPETLIQSAPATPAYPAPAVGLGDIPIAAPSSAAMQAPVDAADIGPVAVTVHARDPLPERWTAARRAAPDLPPMMARSIAQGAASLSRDPGAMLEIALDPPELGRVRLSFVEVNGALGLSIVADRPETVELMRRHLAVLADEFARAGLDAPSVDISGGRGGRAGEHGPRHPPAPLPADFPLPDGPIPVPVARASALVAAGGGLDLRL